MNSTAIPTRALSHLVLVLGAVAMLLPFAWMISTSVKPPDQLFTVPPT
ncbi:MAG: carbohydrate ABC transporter permease, partial [Chloroflexi bacterium]|nr:carbohydrate ABC transporter permease [Chloroflexota bacterium]